MDPAIITQRRRIVAVIGASMLAVLLPLATHSNASLVTIVLPAAAIFWMIAREHRIACQGQQFPAVPRPKKLLLFGLFPAFSLGIVMFWAPSYAAEMNPWVKYGCASFCLALVLVKLYVRYLLIRGRGAPAGEGQTTAAE